MKRMEESRIFEIGQITEGTVTNITPFGAFVDVGPLMKGLVHISEMSEGSLDDFVKDFVSEGETRAFRIIEVDTTRNQVSLSLRGIEPEPEQ